MAARVNAKLWILLVGVAGLSAPQVGAEVHMLPAVPAVKEVRIDGQLTDWDRTGEIALTGAGGHRDPSRHAKVCAMYDKDALYLAFEIADPTPMVNHVNPKTDPSKGWSGDCVQVRLKTSGQGSGKVIYVDSWYCAEVGIAAMQISYPDVATGKPYRHAVNALEAGAACQFLCWEDGRGYWVEMRIPWELVAGESGRPRVNTGCRMGIEVVWGGRSAEIVRWVASETWWPTRIAIPTVSTGSPVSGAGCSSCQQGISNRR